MLNFPQLSPGSVAQYPIRRNTTYRTVANVLPGGRTVLMQDAGAAQVSWELSYAGITDQEWTQIEQLFLATQGSLNTFTLLDPTDNLLSWTEDFAENVWTKDPLLTLASGISDPLGGTGATQITNAAQVQQKVIQTIAAPAGYQYCFSIYLRSDAPLTVNLIRTSASSQVSQAVSVSTGWIRAISAGMLPSQDASIGFGIALPVGVRVYVFGPQAEAQIGPGGYKKNVDRAGVYPNSRFQEDALKRISDGLNTNSAVIRITSRWRTNDMATINQLKELETPGTPLFLLDCTLVSGEV